MIVPRKLRVLHLGKYYPPYRGGIETYLQQLCHALADAVDLRVIVANEGRESVREEVDGITVTRIGTRVRLASAPLCPGMVDAIRAADADVVHVHGPNPGATVALLRSGHPGRVVLSYHSDVVRQRFLGALFSPVQRMLLSRTAAVIVASPNYKQSSAALGPFHDRVHVIPYGIPIERFDQVAEADVRAIRERYGPRLVVAVGRLVYYKGYEVLIDAMGRVRDGRLLIVGTGPLRRLLEERALAAGVGDRVTFLGEVDDVAPFYRAADVFCLASVERSEAFGIVQVEAMASRRPVVNTDLDSGVPFVSLHGLTGLTVPPGDAGALAEAIEKLLDDPELATRYGEAGHRRAHELFSVESMARETLRLYERVASPTASPTSRATGS